MEQHVAEVASLIPSDELPEAIRDELVSWLLGHGDAVRERVVARLRRGAGPA